MDAALFERGPAQHVLELAGQPGRAETCPGRDGAAKVVFFPRAASAHVIQMERIHIRDHAVLVHDIKGNRQRLEETSVSFFIVADLGIFPLEPGVLPLKLF